MNAQSEASGQVASMTGFARIDGSAEGQSWTIEVKSVNGRTLDLRCRLPAGFDALEPVARSALSTRLKRGSVSLTVSLARQSSTAPVRINRDLLTQLAALARELADLGLAPPSLDGLLAVRGVVEQAEDALSESARRAVELALGVDLGRALDQLAQMRLAEGARLIAVLIDHLAEIERLTGAAASLAATQPAALKERLRLQVQALLDAAPALPEERLVQEAALLIAKGDIREELDRLRAHVAAARELIAGGGTIGRQLDFLCQEFNREANTLCSKSTDVELTRLGLALKTAIEQLREQTQNIE